MYNFHLSLAALNYFVGRRKNYAISSILNWFYVCLSPLFSGVFLNVICHSIKKNGNSVVFGVVLSSEVKN